MLDADGGWLELEWFLGLAEGCAFGDELDAFLGFAHFVFLVVVLVVHLGWESRCHGRFDESGGVGRGLGAELGEVEVGAGAVAEVHGFVEFAFGPDAVEDDAVQEEGDYFDDDLDKAAD